MSFKHFHSQRQKKPELLISLHIKYFTLYYVILDPKRNSVEVPTEDSDNWKGLYTFFGFVYPPQQRFSWSAVSFFWKGSHLGLLYLGPSPFDIYCFTTGIIVLTKLRIFLLIKSSKTYGCMFHTFFMVVVWSHKLP